MTSKTLLGLFLLALVTLGAGSGLAQEPSLHDVYQAARSGRMSEAQRMMTQVLRDHPDSGKAHFVQAELLAKQGHYGKAETELATAERLAPGLPFAGEASVHELRSLVGARSRGSAPLVGASPAMPSTPFAATSPNPSGGGLPWGVILAGLGLLAVGFVVVQAMNRRSPASVPGSGYGLTPAPQPWRATNSAPTASSPVMAGASSAGYGSNPAPQPWGTTNPAPAPSAAGGIGRGILGGLATGAAVGAGVVAGEALMHRFMGDHRESAAATPPPENRTPPSDYDLGGSDFGVADSSSWDAGDGDGGSDWS